MKARQPELRGIPQFDSGRWKLRLERVPFSPRKHTIDIHDSHSRVGQNPDRLGHIPANPNTLRR
jgi:hypothetical protein